MTLFWHAAGPLMKYNDGILRIEDLNPEIKTQWRMSRWERFRTGWRFMLSALR